MLVMKKNPLLPVLGVPALLILITTGVVLYAQGYRIDLRKRSLATTGMILAKSLPDGARVLLDEELMSATDSAISGLAPGTYHLKIEKEGYLPWEKDVEVKTGLVTNITALLPPLSPSLTAITRNGARLVTPAPSGTKAAFISGKKLFILPLTNQFLGFLRTRPQEIAEEPAGFSFAKASGLAFSPNEDQILVTAPGKGVLLPVGQGKSQIVTDLAKLRENWRTEDRNRRAETIRELEIPEEFLEIALSSTTAWSPDERKFLYEKKEGDKRKIWIANFTDPLPVGEKINQKILETNNSSLKILWLADSRHLIVLENGTVSLLDLDGSNKRELFKGTLAERVSLSSADLAQVIVLTSIATKSAPNLYAISLR